VASALTALRARLGALRERGPSAAELEAATSYLWRGQPREFETAGGIQRAVSGIALLGLPLDRLAIRRAQLEAITADQVRAAAPDDGATKVIVVGDLAALRAPLSALGWGALEEHDGDGNLVGTKR